MARKITTEIFINDCIKLKGEDNFDYSKVIYERNDKKVCIVCKKHGEFYITPSNFKHSVYGCPKCALEAKTTGTFNFIQRSKEKFGDKFDYSKVEYFTRNNRVKLICPEHGEFEMLPENHLNSPTGCPKCRSNNRIRLVDGKNRKEMREYSIWKAMKTRVTNLNSTDGEHYIKEKGIICCPEWLESFEQFYKDMGPCPEGYSIDRIDNNGNYCPENCRWASRKTQSQNRGEFNKIFSYNGETHVLKEWARKFNINYTTLYNRIYRDGLSFEDAIKDDPFNRLFEFNGEKKTLVEWCKIYDIKYSTVINRIHKHKWTLEEALLTPYKHKKIQV